MKILFNFRCCIILCNILTIFVNSKQRFINSNGDNYDWRLGNPEKIYLVFNGYTEKEAKTTLAHLNLQLGDNDTINTNYFRNLRPLNLHEDPLNLNLKKHEKVANHLKFLVDVLKKDLHNISDIKSVRDNNKVFPDLKSYLNAKQGDMVSNSASEVEDEIYRPMATRSAITCSRTAVITCAKACKSVLKNVCDAYKCNASMKTQFKSECAKSCKQRFGEKVTTTTEKPTNGTEGTAQRKKRRLKGRKVKKK